MASGTDNIEKLVDSESFKFLKFQTTVIFKSQGIFEIVSGESKLDTIKESKEKNEWKKKDAIAQKLIVTSVDKKFLVHIINDEISNDMSSLNYVVFLKKMQRMLHQI